MRRRFDVVRVFRIGRGSRDFGGVFVMFARVQGCALYNFIQTQSGVTTPKQKLGQTKIVADSYYISLRFFHFNIGQLLMYLWLRAVLFYDPYLSGEISGYLLSQNKMRVS